MKDRNYLEQVLLGKLINNKKEYYNNHSLLSSDIFKNIEHKKLYMILDKSLQESGECDLSKFYYQSENKYDAIKLAHECTEKSYDHYIPKNLILMLLENNKMEELENLVMLINKKITNNDEISEKLIESKSSDEE